MPSTWLGSDKYQFCKSLLSPLEGLWQIWWSDNREQNAAEHHWLFCRYLYMHNRLYITYIKPQPGQSHANCEENQLPPLRHIHYTCDAPSRGAVMHDCIPPSVRYLPRSRPHTNTRRYTHHGSSEKKSQHWQQWQASFSTESSDRNPNTESNGNNLQQWHHWHEPQTLTAMFRSFSTGNSDRNPNTDSNDNKLQYWQQYWDHPALTAVTIAITLMSMTIPFSTDNIDMSLKHLQQYSDCLAVTAMRWL